MSEEEWLRLKAKYEGTYLDVKDPDSVKYNKAILFGDYPGAEDERVKDCPST